MLLDEPTSGLDATSAKTLIAQLKRLAITDDLTIIISIHQPRMEIVDRFDSVLLLARGETIYWGTAERAVRYFRRLGFPCPEDQNPIEYLVDLISENPHVNTEYILEATTPETTSTGHSMESETRLRFLTDAWKSSTKLEEVNSSAASTCRTRRFVPNTSRWTEIKALVGREYLHFRRSGGTYWSILLGNTLVGLLVGFIWFQLPDDAPQGVQDRVGLLAFYPRDRVLIVTSITLMTLTKWRIKRERRASMYRSESFFIAVMTFYWLCDIFFASIFAIIAYYIAGLRYTPFTALLILLGLHILVLTIAYGMGLTIGCLFEDFSTGVLVGTLIWYLLFLMNGLLRNSAEITWVLRWIRYISPPWYYLTGAVQNEFIGQTLYGQTGQYWVDLWGFNGASVMWCAGALMVITAALLSIAYIAIDRTTRTKFII